MKKIMKTKLILQTFATALLFLLLGCRTELETELGKNIPNENQNRISFSQFKNETRTKDLKQNFLTLAKNAKISSKENQVPFIFIIDTLNINRLDFDKKTTYSFRAYNIFENPDKRYNLVYFYKNDKWNFSILELLANNKSKPIYDSRFGEIIEAQNTQSGRVCLMAYTSYSFHCTHTGSCASGVCDGCDLCVTRTSGYVYADCGGLNGSGDDGSGTGNPGDSGGGTSNASQDPSGYTYDPYIEPNTDPEYVRAVRASNYWQQVAVIGNGASQWANEHPDLYCNILENYLNNYSTTNNTNNLNFANWGIGFLAENTVNGVCNISWTQFQYIIYNKTSYETNLGDDDNNTIGGYDNTIYNTFNPQQQPWTTIQNVLTKAQFIGWGYPGVKRNCMDYCKAQIGIKGYQISNYSATGQTIQMYTAQNGVNKSKVIDGLSYLKYALSKGIPVIVGVDDAPGNPGNADQTTDHFIVIVGMGTDSKGNYFSFFDNASGDANLGASPNNKLYYDSVTGLIQGTSDTPYASGLTYTLTQIRKSKLK